MNHLRGRYQGRYGQHSLQKRSLVFNFFPHDPPFSSPLYGTNQQSGNLDGLLPCGVVRSKRVLRKQANNAIAYLQTVHFMMPEYTWTVSSTLGGSTLPFAFVVLCSADKATSVFFQEKVRSRTISISFQDPNFFKN